MIINRKIFLISLAAIIIVLVGCFYYGAKNQDKSSADSIWQAKKAVIKGSYCDAEVIDSGNGQFRMYYSVEPEVPGNNLEIYSALSSDGINWKKEKGTRTRLATFPDAIKLSDGRIRLYFQNNGVIKSAISSDGLEFTNEPGVRIDKTEAGFSLDNVGASTTTQLSDGSFIMIYRGIDNNKYKVAKTASNQGTSYFFSAVSADGISWQKKGLILDSRNGKYYGLIDGPEWIKWSDGSERLYFWTYSGIYHLTFEGDHFLPDVAFDLMNQSYSSPPSDPTLAKINNKWFMYYGQHKKGIYYAVLK